MDSILTLSGVSKSYQTNRGELSILKNISVDVKEGETLSLSGSSGSGKSTLLAICAGLDKPSSGTVSLCGQNLTAMNEDQRADVRLKNVGFIFQAFELIPSLTALENVMVPSELLGEKKAKKLSEEMLERVGLKERMTHYPSEMSGGEQQRVAIARAFVTKPRVLFADEPTGNLDNKTAEQIEELLFQLNKEEGTTLVLVTHDQDLAAKANINLRLYDGEIASSR